MRGERINNCGWTRTEAIKGAKLCREHGLRARAVVTKHYDAYVRIYDDGSSDFGDKFNRVRRELEVQHHIVRCELTPIQQLARQAE